MSHRIKDLRQKIAPMLRDALDGREVDMIEMGKPEIPHMLGIVPIGAISTREVEKGTILDPQHDFWNNYEKEINTKNKAIQEVYTAIESLQADGILQITELYGDNSDVLYVEVEGISDESDKLETTCAECGASILTEPEISMNYGQYSLTFRLDCPDCEFEQKATELLRLHQ